MRAWKGCRFAVVAALLATLGCREHAPELDPVAAPEFSPEGGAYGGALDVTIRSETDGAGILYTIDGSTPSEIHGRVYDGCPLSVTSTVTIRAIAWMSDRADSPVASATYVLAGTAETPVFSPDAGTGPFDEALRVTMSSGTPAARIWYTTDGSDPRPAEGYGTEYDGVPVPIAETTTLRAAAWKPGLSPSMIAEAVYVIRQPTAIDWEGDVGRYCAMAQTTGALLIAYHDHTNGRLKLARSADGGATWATSFIDYDWQSDMGHAISIAARDGLVAVAYRVAGAADLRCALSTDSGLTWHRQAVSGAGADCQYTSTAIGPSGTIHIAYYEAGSTDLKLAWSDDQGATWNVRALHTSANDVGRYVSLALNGTRVYVAYYDATAGDLRFGWAAGPAPANAFQSAPLDTAGNVGQYCSLRYDQASNTIWLAYYDASGCRLKIVSSAGGEANWSLAGVVDDDGATGLYGSLAVWGAAGENLAIAYYEDWEYRLKVARSSDAGANWTTAIVDEGGVGQWASMVATGVEALAVCYYDALEGDLRLAAWNGTGWTVR